MTSAEDITRFALAGNAKLTLTSRKTGNHFTYRIRKSDDGKLHFVSVLTGPDNESSFTYMGLIRPTSMGPEFMRSAKSKVADDAPSFSGFVYFWQWVNIGKEVPESLEVRHEGRCGRCGRTLTVPESIDRGIGPECWSQMGMD